MINLGNISIDEFIKRTGYNLSDDDRKLLELHRQDNASIISNSDKFHIFDIPFSITVGEKFSTKLINILQKYENINKSKESLSIYISKETEEEKENRLKEEKLKQELQDRLENPNSIWLVKWHMYVPVVVDNTECYYWCFINTYTTGRENIPDIIDGKGEISFDENGFTGTFKLYNPETDNDANEHDEWNYVIGCGYVTKSGSERGRLENLHFNNVEFSIKDCIQNYMNFNNSAKETYFDRIKKEC